MDDKQHEVPAATSRKDKVYKVEVLDAFKIDTGEVKIKCRLASANSGTYHVQCIDLKSVHDGYIIMPKIVNTLEFSLTLIALPYKGKPQELEFKKGEVIAEAIIIQD